MENNQSCEEFINSFYQCESLKEQIEYLSTTKFDLYMLSQPLALCDYLFIDSIADARIVAQILINKMGNIIIDREASYRSGKLTTIIDNLTHELLSMHECDETYKPFKYLRYALISFGMKGANSYDPKVLSYIYASDPKYRHQTMRFENYDTIASNESLKKELIEYLHQPRLVENWIENGNDILDYLL